MVKPALETLALFPLADVVLLPDVSVPLYIFEPRYRQMTRDALAGDRQIGMIAVRPNADSQMAEDPPLFAVGCLGRIIDSQERPDGTFHIILQGQQRFRILEEHSRPPDQLYRAARVELLEDAPPASDADRNRLDTTRGEVLRLLTSLIENARPGQDVAQYVQEFAALDSARLINTLTQSIAFDPIERQQLIEADSVVSRFETMADLLRFRIAATATPNFGDATKLN